MSTPAQQLRETLRREAELVDELPAWARAAVISDDERLTFAKPRAAATLAGMSLNDPPDELARTEAELYRGVLIASLASKEKISLATSDAELAADAYRGRFGATVQDSPEKPVLLGELLDILGEDGLDLAVVSPAAYLRKRLETFNAEIAALKDFGGDAKRILKNDFELSGTGHIVDVALVAAEKYRKMLGVNATHRKRADDYRQLADEANHKLDALADELAQARARIEELEGTSRNALKLLHGAFSGLSGNGHIADAALIAATEHKKLKANARSGALALDALKALFPFDEPAPLPWAFNGQAVYDADDDVVPSRTWACPAAVVAFVNALGPATPVIEDAKPEPPLVPCKQGYWWCQPRDKTRSPVPVEIYKHRGHFTHGHDGLSRVLDDGSWRGPCLAPGEEWSP